MLLSSWFIVASLSLSSLIFSILGGWPFYILILDDANIIYCVSIRDIMYLVVNQWSHKAPDVPCSTVPELGIIVH